MAATIYEYVSSGCGEDQRAELSFHLDATPPESTFAVQVSTGQSCSFK
jgi:hypothetical protein